MEITLTRNDGELLIMLSGRLDTLTSADLEEKLEEELDGVRRLVFDLSKLEYLSSAGLRVFVGSYRAMEKRDGMVLRNPNRSVMEVFEITGLEDAFDFESSDNR